MRIENELRHHLVANIMVVELQAFMKGVAKDEDGCPVIAMHGH